MGRLSGKWKGFITKDATATAAEIQTGFSAYGPDGKIDGTGGTNYAPGGISYDGVNQDMSTSITRSGNKLTFVARLQGVGYNEATETFRRFYQTSSSQPSIYTYPTDRSTYPGVIVFLVRNTGSTAVCNIASTTQYNSGPLSILFAYDGDNGTKVLTINGTDEDDLTFPGRTVTTGTLNSGSQTNVIFGGASDSRNHEGWCSFLGLSNSYITDYSLFFDAQNNPIEQDTSNWASTGWGSQPLVWCPEGEGGNNYGSGGNFSRNSGPTSTPFRDVYP